MANVTLTKIEGEAIGYKVSNDHYQQILDVVEFFRDNDFKLYKMHSAVNPIGPGQTVTAVFKKDENQVPMSHLEVSNDYYLINHEGNPKSLSKDHIEGLGLIIIDDEVFQSSREFYALCIDEFNDAKDLFCQIFDWCKDSGHDIDSFHNTEHGFCVEIDCEKSESLCTGDYLFFDEHGHLMTYAFENLKEDGYEVQK